MGFYLWGGVDRVDIVKYSLFRDYRRNVWILLDFWTNEIILVCDNTERINRYVKMKKKLKENQERLAHIEWVKQGGF